MSNGHVKFSFEGVTFSYLNTKVLFAHDFG